MSQELGQSFYREATLCIALGLACFRWDGVAVARDILVVVGNPYMAKDIAAASAAMGGEQPEVQYETGGGVGRHAGAKCVADNSCDIALIAGEFVPTDSRVVVRHVARDGIAIITHASTGVTRLSSAQVRGIFAGKIRNWKYLGGSDVPIVLFARPPALPEAIVFQKFLGFPPQGRYDGMGTSEDLAMIIAATPGAVGFVNTHAALSASKIGTWNVLAVDDIAPNIVTLSDASYPLSRSLHVAYREADKRAGLELFLRAIDATDFYRNP